jgi:hypothetical protein
MGDDAAAPGVKGGTAVCAERSTDCVLNSRCDVKIDFGSGFMKSIGDRLFQRQQDAVGGDPSIKKVRRGNAFWAQGLGLSELPGGGKGV